MAIYYLSLIFLLIYARPGHAEIGASSDLNCDFGSLCRWRNVTGSADSGDFGISNRVEPGPGTFIMPMEEGDESGFAYTMGLMGRTVALLVSEVINCQLGGASLQYWYYKTGPAASLEVCIRQPPGNLEPTGLRCYEGASPNYGRVWSFRAIELPPIGQPFEVIFRSYYSPPTDIIALDNITYSAALCPENSTQLTHHSAIRPKRSPPLIGIKDWEAYRRSQHYKGEPMIIVAQDVGQPTTTPSTTTKFDFERSALLGTHFVFKDPILQPTSTTTTTILPPSSSPTSTTTEPPKSSSTTSTTELPSTSSESSTIISTTAVTTTSNPNQGSDSIENFVKFIKQTAPVLPYIPSFVRSLTGLDPRYASAAIGSADLSNSAAFALPEAPPTLIPEIPEIPDMRRAPVHSTQIYHTEMDTSQINNNNPSTEDSESLLSIAEKAGIISSSDLKTTMLPPIVPMNAYGLGATRLPIKKTKDVVPIYPRGLVRSKSKTFKSDSDLAEHERIKGLKKDWDNPEKLLAKVFKAATTTTSHPELVQRPQLRPKANIQPTTNQPLTIFKNPLPVENEVAGKLASLTKNLSPTQLNEIKMLRNIPDFQGLVKGMDFSLITKGNAGYQALKNEFIRRLMMRNLGLPFTTNETKIAPKPIVPVKVTRRMMAEKHKRPDFFSRDLKNLVIFCSKSTNNGAEESAGGTFGDDSDLMMAMSSSSSSMTKSSMLTDFQGNEVSVPTDFAPPPPRDPFLAQSSPNLNRPVHLAAPTASGEELRSVTTVPHSSNIAGPRQGPLFKPRCSGIDCTFDDHRLCNYVTSEKNTSNLVDARSLHDWMITSQGVLNSLTGIPNDLSKNGGSFIYAGGKEVSPLDTFILSSNEPVQITEPSRLDFFVYQAGIKGRFRVCIDSLVDCALVLKGSDIDADSQRWKNYYVELRPGKHVVHFIADKLQDNYAIGLDHIQLLNRLGTAAQNC